MWDIPNCILIMSPLTEPPPQPATGKIKWYVIDKVLYTMDWLGHIHVVGPLPELPNG